MENYLDENIYKQRTKLYEEDIRGCYFRDQTAIIHSSAFRRLKHKTQVFYAPKNDHICTRIEHVLHVATIAKTICKGLKAKGWTLDSEMIYAIGLGHDLGHAPFGHDGENILNKLMGGNMSFIHELHSYRVVQYLAKNGQGLNLTYGVKDGIITHNGEKYERTLKPSTKPNDLDLIVNRKVVPSSFEGCIVRFSDKIAYLGRDIEDAIVAGLIKADDLPEEFKKRVGTTNSEIIDKYVNDIINVSFDKDYIGLSEEMFELLLKIRDFNYKYIYLNDKDLLFPYAERMLTELFNFLADIYDKFRLEFEKYKNSKITLVQHFGQYLNDLNEFYGDKTPLKRVLGDYIAGMTDDFAIEAFKEITIPKSVI